MMNKKRRFVEEYLRCKFSAKFLENANLGYGFSEEVRKLHQRSKTWKKAAKKYYDLYKYGRMVRYHVQDQFDDHRRKVHSENQRISRQNKSLEKEVKRLNYVIEKLDGNWKYATEQKVHGGSSFWYEKSKEVFK